MAGIMSKSFDSPDERRTPDKTQMDVVKLGGVVAARMTAQPGWRWSECIKPVVGTESCQVEHVGYVVSGSMHVEHADGDADITAGDVYRIPPGHDAHVVGDEPVVVVEFQGAATYARS